MTRRTFLPAAGASALAMAGAAGAAPGPVRKGRLKQGVTRLGVASTEAVLDGGPQ